MPVYADGRRGGSRHSRQSPPPSALPAPALRAGAAVSERDVLTEAMRVLAEFAADREIPDLGEVTPETEIVPGGASDRTLGLLGEV